MFFIILLTLLMLLFQVATIKGGNENEKVVNLLSVFVLTLICYVLSFRTGVGVNQSDILVYNSYMECLEIARDYEDCNSSIGAPSTELTLYIITKLVRGIGLDYSLVLFLCSFLFSFGLYLLYKPLGYMIPFALFLSLVDNNYWELSANILRQSLALSFFLFYYTVSRSGHKSAVSTFCKFVLLLLSICSHTMGAIYFFCYFLAIFFSTKVALITLFLGVFLGEGVLPQLLIQFSDFIDFRILKKIRDYTTSEVQSSFFSIVGKLNLLILLLVVYLSKVIKEDFYKLTLRLLLFLLAFGAIFASTPIIYRVLNLVPFLMTFLLLFLIKKKVRGAPLLLLMFLLWNLTFNLLGYLNSLRFIIYEV